MNMEKTATTSSHTQTADMSAVDTLTLQKSIMLKGLLNYRGYKKGCALVAGGAIALAAVFHWARTASEDRAHAIDPGAVRAETYKPQAAADCSKPIIDPFAKEVIAFALGQQTTGQIQADFDLAALKKCTDDTARALADAQKAKLAREKESVLGDARLTGGVATAAVGLAALFTVLAARFAHRQRQFGKDLKTVTTELRYSRMAVQRSADLAHQAHREAAGQSPAVGS